MSDYIIHYDIGAIIILVTVFIHFMYKKNIETEKTRIFTTFVWVAIITTVLEIATIITISFAASIPLWVNYVLNCLYLMGFNCTPIVYYLYIRAVTNTSLNKLSLKEVIRLIPLMFSLINIMFTGITKWIFYFDENYKYARGPLMVILYIIATFYIFTAVGYTIKHREILSRRQKTSIYFFTMSMMLAIVIQNIYPEILIVHFAFAISILLMYLSLENPDDYADKKLGVFNNLAFTEVVEDCMDKKRKFKLMVVKVEGLDYVNETLGKHSRGVLVKQITDFLSEVCKKELLFIIGDVEFAIMINDNGATCKRLELEIYDRFRTPFEVEDGEVTLTANICVIKYPDDIKNKNSLVRMIDYSINKSKELGEEKTVYADEALLEQGKRESQIIQIMKQALRDDGFEVYYQPIYSVEKGRFTSAEALIRLKSEELGFISPEEFIPLAEKNGLILEIGEFVFCDVCEFITTYKIWEKGIEYIDVNLSVVQCMQENLYKTLMRIMDEYQLEYYYINLEITETAAVISSETLKKNMEKLMKRGIKFSLDDYGTGYSNTANLIKYTFHTIKIDKSMVWEAMVNEKAMCALKHTIAMVKDMNMELVVEGIETEEQVQLLTKLGCDFFQGYFYSKPIRKDDFYKRISEQDK